jgi:hypothetical protein
MATIPQHQWVSKLMGFNFLVEYKPGTSNTVVDALSRREEVVVGELVVLSAPQFKMFDDLRTDIEEVAVIRKLRDEIIAGGRGDKWQVIDGLVTVAGKVYVLTTSPHLPAILSAVHDMGHEGTEKTLNHLQHDFYVLGA